MGIRLYLFLCQKTESAVETRTPKPLSAVVSRPRIFLFEVVKNFYTFDFVSPSLFIIFSTIYLLSYNGHAYAPSYCCLEASSSASAEG